MIQRFSVILVLVVLVTFLAGCGGQLLSREDPVPSEASDNINGLQDNTTAPYGIRGTTINATDLEIARRIGNVSVNKTVETIITIIFCIFLFGFLILGIFDISKGKDPVLLLMFPGAVLCSLIEGTVGIIGHIFIFEGSITVFTIAGRPIPLWAVLGYTLAFTMIPYMMYRIAKGGASVKKLMIWLGIGIVLNIILEGPLTAMGIYAYWGIQPLDLSSVIPFFGNFSLVWAVTNMTGGAVAGILIATVPSLFSGWRILRIVPAVPFVVLGWVFAAGWPFYTGINHNGLSQNPDAVIAAIGALATIALSFWAYYIIAKLASNSNSPKDRVPRAMPVGE